MKNKKIVADAKQESIRLENIRLKKAIQQKIKKTEKAPDKEKLFSVAKKLRNTKTTVKSNQAKKALEDAAVLLDKVVDAMIRERDK